ncbi:hypothetical protein EV356DRAFT_565962 [Viridothelium virens]|uniref:Uncharacterized protein n=1 Tax=Viridothelium virens TaxID=1048519 RepID=A0A6A6HEP2_VIRVR|nr:hypothetical protein EV356DRAFT_565962 [Viridothelium virens]
MMRVTHMSYSLPKTSTTTSSSQEQSQLDQPSLNHLLIINMSLAIRYPTSSLPLKLPTFTRFSKLPLELRQQIWGYYFEGLSSDWSQNYDDPCGKTVIGISGHRPDLNIGDKNSQVSLEAAAVLHRKCAFALPLRLRERHLVFNMALIDRSITWQIKQLVFTRFSNNRRVVRVDYGRLRNAFPALQIITFDARALEDPKKPRSQQLHKGRFRLAAAQMLQSFHYVPTLRVVHTDTGTHFRLALHRIQLAQFWEIGEIRQITATSGINYQALCTHI